MAFATNGSASIHYERMAGGDGPAVILLAGAGRPSTDFDHLFCAPLVAAGFVPIRIDSRDTGRSVTFVDAALDLHAIRAGDAKPPYGIADMAGDVIAVMAAEGVDRAHFVGRSIGGLVAQQLAVQHPDRVASLALIMAMSRSMADVIPDAALDRLMAEHIPDEDGYVTRQLGVAEANGMAEDRDAVRVADEAARHPSRGNRPAFRREPCRARPSRRARRRSGADTRHPRTPRQGHPAGARDRDRGGDPRCRHRDRRDNGT